MKKDVKKIKSPKVKQYKVYKANASSFGFWIIPLVIIIILGLFYIFLKVLLQNPDLFSATSKTSIGTMKDITINNDVTNNRQRAGVPVDLNEINWGREDPFTPAN